MVDTNGGGGGRQENPQTRRTYKAKENVFSTTNSEYVENKNVYTETRVHENYLTVHENYLTAFDFYAQLSDAGGSVLLRKILL